MNRVYSFDRLCSYWMYVHVCACVCIVTMCLLFKLAAAIEGAISHTIKNTFLVALL